MTVFHLALLLSGSIEANQFQVKAEEFSWTEFMSSVTAAEKCLSEFRSVTNVLVEYSKSAPLRHLKYIHPDPPRPDTVQVIEVPTDTLLNHQCLGFEIQSIGFPNFITWITGYGFKTRAENLKLRIENLKLEGASEDTIQAVELQYNQAQQEFEDFLNSRRWSD